MKGPGSQEKEVYKGPLWWVYEWVVSVFGTIHSDIWRRRGTDEGKGWFSIGHSSGQYKSSLYKKRTQGRGKDNGDGKSLDNNLTWTYIMKKPED